MIDSKLADSVEELRVPEKTRLQPNDSLGDALGGAIVGQTVESIAESRSLPNFDHL